LVWKAIRHIESAARRRARGKVAHIASDEHVTGVGEATDGQPALRGDALEREISRTIVRLLREYTGRGPTRARTTISGALIVCLLEDTMTTGERTLVANGHRDAVLQMRASYQEAMKGEAVAAVEALTGRKVLAFMSTNHTDPDFAAEVFVLDQGVDREALASGGGTAE
jgi:uncharacterized protein YbcI